MSPAIRSYKFCVVTWIPPRFAFSVSSDVDGPSATKTTLFRALTAFVIRPVGCFVSRNSLCSMRSKVYSCRWWPGFSPKNVIVSLSIQRTSAIASLLLEDENLQSISALDESSIFDVLQRSKEYSTVFRSRSPLCVTSTNRPPSGEKFAAPGENHDPACVNRLIATPSATVTVEPRSLLPFVTACWKGWAETAAATITTSGKTQITTRLASPTEKRENHILRFLTVGARSAPLAARNETTLLLLTNPQARLELKFQSHLD